MHEQSKAAVRRVKDWHFTNLYFRGKGLDIGAQPDPLWKNCGMFPLIEWCDEWNAQDGDGQTLKGVEERSYDFIHASHVLEHLNSPRKALKRWIEVVDHNGYIIITVPDYEMYERFQWPSIFSNEHKHHFGSTDLMTMFREHLDDLVVERFQVIREHYDPRISCSIDQSLGPAECAIEAVLRVIR